VACPVRSGGDSEPALNAQDAVRAATGLSASAHAGGVAWGVESLDRLSGARGRRPGRVSPMSRDGGAIEVLGAPPSRAWSRRGASAAGLHREPVQAVLDQVGERGSSVETHGLEFAEPRLTPGRDLCDLRNWVLS